MRYLKQAPKQTDADDAQVRSLVEGMLKEIEVEGEAKALEYAKKLDGFDGDILVDRAQMEAAGDEVPSDVRDDIRFAHDNVRRFAEMQLASLQDCEIEVTPGLIAGQKQIPMQAAGCYVPGGRYSHVASAIMTVTTAKVAGVDSVTACSPPKPGAGINPAILYTLNLCGVDRVLNLGGVQGIAAMAFGLFGAPKADILVGPGNQFVAEAKRILFGRVGIDMFAGPTESLIIADATSDPLITATDLVSQAEHGYNSPVWLVSLDEALANRVAELMPGLIDALPEPNRSNAEAAWRDFGEIVLADDRSEAVRISDEYAPEHLQVMVEDLDWWLARLRNYGSLFLGEETTVTYGDKSSGPNHVLPTRGAGRYTGGLSVAKFVKTVTWQRANRNITQTVGSAAARISRTEGMEGHARSADVRLAKWFDAS